MEEIQIQGEQKIEEAVIVAPVIERLYQVAIRSNGSERMVTVIAQDVREALTKIADKIEETEFVFEVKYINEVHVK